MTGRVPEDVLRRSTKGDYSLLAYRGLRTHHQAVRDLLTNSTLADLGLLDERAVHIDVALGASGRRIPLAALDRVLGVEHWLRTLPRRPRPVGHREVAHA